MRLVSAFLASLVLASLLPRAANADSVDASLQDIERYLLLYSATGDERFLVRLDNLGTTFEQSLGQQKNAGALKDMWQLYRQALDRVRAAYSQPGVDLKVALAQTQEVAGLFDSFIIADKTAKTAPTLADDLRELALMEARQANRKLLGGLEEKDSSRIAQLQEAVEKQLNTLPAGPARDTLLSRWTYLRKAERSDGGTLLYAFNAQIEYLLAHLPKG